jgi:hypothetical protein
MCCKSQFCCAGIVSLSLYSSSSSSSFVFFYYPYSFPHDCFSSTVKLSLLFCAFCDALIATSGAFFRFQSLPSDSDEFMSLFLIKKKFAVMLRDELRFLLAMFHTGETEKLIPVFCIITSPS